MSFKLATHLYRLHQLSYSRRVVTCTYPSMTTAVPLAETINIPFFSPSTS